MSAAKPKVGKEVVYVDHDDEITSVIDKVEATKQKVVAIVLPKRFTTLQSIVNMRLLKRGAESASKNVVLITSEKALLPLAGAAGIHVAKNLQSKPEVPPSPLDQKELPEEPADPDADIAAKAAKLDYHRSIGELASAHEDEDPESIPLDEDSADEGETPVKKPKKDKKLAVPDFDRFRLLLAAGGIGIIGLIVFLFFALNVMPKATITIKTASTPVTAEFDLAASDKFDQLDEGKMQIPAQLKKEDQEAIQTVQATGQKNLGEKATGSVKLINCGGSNVTIPAGTGVSANGLFFITQKSLSLDSGNFSPPPGSTCKTTGSHTGSVNVIAQSAGSKYNIGPSSFSVSGFSSVNGSSSAAMSGGTDKNVTVLMQQDVENAKKKITSAESDKFSQDLQKKLEDEGFYVIGSTLKLDDPVVTATPAVGQEATSASVTVKITYSLLVVPRADLEKVLKSYLNEQIDAKRQEISDDDVLKKAAVSVVNQESPSSATLNVSIETTAVPIIDDKLIKQQAGGKKESEIKNMLAGWPGVEGVEVEMSPFWVSKAPKKPAKINIVLQEMESGSQGRE